MKTELTIKFEIDTDGNFEAKCTYKKDLSTRNVICSGNITLEEDYRNIAENYVQFMKSLERYSTGKFNYSSTSPSK